MRRLDGYIIRSLLTNYLIGLGVMLSLYVALDLFVNMDEFTESQPEFLTLVRNIVDYYAPNLFRYFAQLSAVISAFACLATLARLRLQNETTAILASGVSLYRVAVPLTVFGVLTAGLMAVNAEVCLPAVAHKLARSHDDVVAGREIEVLFLTDRSNALVSAASFRPDTQELHNLMVLYRNEQGAVTGTLEADHAVWEPGTPTTPGRWRLTRGRQYVRVRTPEAAVAPREQQEVTYPAYFETDLSPEEIELRQDESWIRSLDLRRLRELEARRVPELATVIQTRHARLTAPLASIVMLLLGLPFFLDRSPANVLTDAGKCMIACGLFYIVSFVSQNIVPDLPSPFPAWFPILVFAPVAAMLLTRVRT